MSETSYRVEGMTCEHCVQTVTREVTRIDGVDAVKVDLAAGQVTVAGTGYDDAVVRSAIEGAGYTVTS